MTKVSVIAKEKWRTILFSVKKQEDLAIELTINMETKKFTLCSNNQEGVSFNDDTLGQAKIRLACVASALKYLEELEVT